MSIEQVKAFFAHASADPITADRFNSAALESADAVSRLGQEHGYSFSAEDAMAALEDYESGELSDDDLDLVSAGGAPTCNPPLVGENRSAAPA